MLTQVEAQMLLHAYLRPPFQRGHSSFGAAFSKLLLLLHMWPSSSAKNE